MSIESLETIVNKAEAKFDEQKKGCQKIWQPRKKTNYANSTLCCL